MGETASDWLSQREEAIFEENFREFNAMLEGADVKLLPGEKGEIQRRAKKLTAGNSQIACNLYIVCYRNAASEGMGWEAFDSGLKRASYMLQMLSARQWVLLRRYINRQDDLWKTRQEALRKGVKDGKFSWGRDSLPMGTRICYADVSRAGLHNVGFGYDSTDKILEFIRVVLVDELQKQFGKRLTWPQGMPDPHADELVFAVLPDENRQPLSEADHRKAMKKISGKLLSELISRFERRPSADEDLLFVPEGSFVLKRAVTDWVIYNFFVQNAELAQSLAKERKHKAYMLSTNSKQPPSRSHPEGLLSTAALREIDRRSKDMAAQVTATLGNIVEVEGLGPSLALYRLEGRKSDSRFFWKELIEAVRKVETPSVYIVRHAPDKYYMIRNYGWDKMQKRSKVQIVRIEPFYHAFSGTDTDRLFDLVFKSSEREDFLSFGGEKFYGCKCPAGLLGRPYTTQMIQMQEMAAQDNFRAGDQRMPAEEIIDAGKNFIATADSYTEKYGFKTYLDMCEVSDDDFTQETSGYEMLSILEDLHQARAAVQMTAKDESGYKTQLRAAFGKIPGAYLKKFAGNNMGAWLSRDIRREVDKINDENQLRARNKLSLDNKKVAAGSMLESIIYRNNGYDRSFDEFIASENFILDRLAEDPDMQGAARATVLAQAAVLLYRIPEYAGERAKKIKSAADFILKTRKRLGFIGTEESKPATARNLQNRNYLYAMAFIAQALQDKDEKSAGAMAMLKQVTEEPLKAEVEVICKKIVALLPGRGGNPSAHGGMDLDLSRTHRDHSSFNSDLTQGQRVKGFEGFNIDVGDITIIRYKK